MTNKLRAALLIATFALLAMSTAAIGTSWDAFSNASFTGVSVTPTFVTNTLTYNLSLGASPTITIAGNTYNISWIQGFYALSNNGVSKFYAGGDNIVSGGKTTWKWDTNPNIDSPNNYLVAGWSAQGNGDRILPSSNMSFSYTDFDTKGTPIVLGLHVGYINNGQQTVVTAFFKENQNTAVPEAPASLLFALGGPMLGAAAYLRKRFGR